MTKKILKPVTVYFSFSHDDTFESCEQSGQTVALKKVTVPYFDLALYGLENFYFASEDYGPASGDPTGGIRLTIHEKPAVKGDIDGDGVIDVNDVMALSGAINSGDDLDAAIADINGDGVVDTFDVMALYEIIKSND